MVERYSGDLEMAYSADDIERIVKGGKIASLIGNVKCCSWWLRARL